MSGPYERPLKPGDDLSPAASNIVDSWPQSDKIPSDLASSKRETQELSSANPKVADKGKQKATAEPQTVNSQDPFDILDDVLIEIIIAELDATDTETLRRVSRLWKATSEAHCGRALFLKHFPEEAASLDLNEVGSVEEENLRFRRHLYRRQSFRLGYATRAFRCTGARSWDLKNDTVVWNNTDGEVSFRTLRADRAGVQVSSQVADEKIDLSRILLNFCFVEKVSLLKGGDLIVESFVRPELRRGTQRGRRNNSGDYNTARVSKTGQVLWEIVNDPHDWSRPAIGQTEVFFIVDGSSLHSARAGVFTKPLLIKYSLQDGSVVPGFERDTRDAGTKINRSPDALFLTNHEKFAIWTADDDLISIISTTNREQIYQFHKKSSASLSKSLIDESLWVIDNRLKDASSTELEWVGQRDPLYSRDCSYFLSWKETTTDFDTIQPIQFPEMVSSPGFKWVFHADSAVFTGLRIVHWRKPPFIGRFPSKRVEEPQSKVIEPVQNKKRHFGSVVIAATHQIHSMIPGHIEFEIERGPVAVSLPTSAK